MALEPSRWLLCRFPSLVIPGAWTAEANFSQAKGLEMNVGPQVQLRGLSLKLEAQTNLRQESVVSMKAGIGKPPQRQAQDTQNGESLCQDIQFSTMHNTLHQCSRGDANLYSRLFEISFMLGKKDLPR